MTTITAFAPAPLTPPSTPRPLDPDLAGLVTVSRGMGTRLAAGAVDLRAAAKQPNGLSPDQARDGARLLWENMFGFQHVAYLAERGFAPDGPSARWLGRAPIGAGLTIRQLHERQLARITQSGPLARDLDRYADAGASDPRASHELAERFASVAYSTSYEGLVNTLQGVRYAATPADRAVEHVAAMDMDGDGALSLLPTGPARHAEVLDPTNRFAGSADFTLLVRAADADADHSVTPAELTTLLARFDVDRSAWLDAYELDEVALIYPVRASDIDPRRPAAG